MWGSYRGEATGHYTVEGTVTVQEVPNHPPAVVSKYLSGADLFASCNMILGNCKAKHEMFNFQEGSIGQGQTNGAYAIAVASPFVSISIELARFHFEVTMSGIGSRAKAKRSKYYSANSLHI